MKHDMHAQFERPADVDKTSTSGVGNGKKFKILLMTEAAGSGVGRHILDLAQGLAICGHDVHLLYSPGRAEDRFLQRVSELEGKIKVAQIPMDRSVNPKHDLSSLAKIKEYIKVNGPFDFIHGHSSKAGALARLLKVSGAHSASIVYTPHAFITLSPNLSGKEKLMYRIIERGLGSLFTDAVVAVSHHEAEHASNDIGIPVRKVNVIANGVDIDDESAKLRESYRKSIGAKAEDIVIGFSGRLDYQKAPEVLLKAFLSISSDSRLHLVMLGDGPKREELEQMIKNHPAAANIHLLGYHPFASAVLSALDVFVLPSRYEGLPYVLLEAMAMGLPIVATSVGGNSELVRDGVNGFLVSPDSVEELSTALSMLSSDSNIREFFGRSSFEMVKDSYRTQLMIDSTIELYQRLRGSSKCS